MRIKIKPEFHEEMRTELVNEFGEENLNAFDSINEMCKEEGVDIDTLYMLACEDHDKVCKINSEEPTFDLKEFFEGLADGIDCGTMEVLVEYGV